MKSILLATILATALTGCDSSDDTDAGTQRHNSGNNWLEQLAVSAGGAYLGARLANHHSYGGGYPHTTHITHSHVHYHVHRYGGH